MNTALANVISVVRRPVVWIPAVALALAAVAIWWWPDLDLGLERQFFAGDAASRKLGGDWPLKETQPWKALYLWGVYPAWILGCAGAVAYLASFRWPKLERWRKAGLFYALLLAIGPGLLVNVICKPYFKRPRPRDTLEIVQADGSRPYVRVGQRGSDDGDKSFPSGHAAMGFYLMAPAFVLYYRRKWLAAGFLLLGLACGSVMGFTRIVAGGHFVSDALGSCGLIYFTALALAALFHFEREQC